MSSTSRTLTNRHNTLLAPEVDFIVVDGSGSMVDKWWDFMASLDIFVDALRRRVNSHTIVSVFDDKDVSMIQRDCPIAEWKCLKEEPLTSSWGYTPLYDAINAMGRHMKELDPPKASIVIVTDGNENRSLYTTHAQARAILDWCRAKGWQVTFLGCDFNNSKQAKLLGVGEANAIGVQKKLLSEAAALLAAKRIRHSVADEDINFSEDERQQFGGLLPKPE